MKKTKNEERIIDVFVNRCIDNIIKHEVIEGVTDLKSFANFALPLDWNDDKLVRSIEQGYEISYNELSDEKREELDSFAFSSLYDTEYPMGGVTIRAYEKGKLNEYLLTITHNRICQLLKKGIADIQ